MNDNFSEKDISIEFFEKLEADDFVESLTSVSNGRSDIEFGLCYFCGNVFAFNFFCIFLEDDEEEKDTEDEEEEPKFVKKQKNRNNILQNHKSKKVSFGVTFWISLQFVCAFLQ